MDITTVDHLLTTTRSVRRRLDLERPVEREVIEACLEIAVQAPNGGNANRYHFVVVTEPDLRAEVAAIYRAAYDEAGRDPSESSPRAASSNYLADHLHEVPVHVIPCIEYAPSAEPTPYRLATRYGSILPATWSFMLALRARGLGAAWTTMHLARAHEMASLLGLPANILQVALLPVAWFKGSDFKPAPRLPARDRTHWNGWDPAGRP